MLDKSPACGGADAHRAIRRRYIPPHYFVPRTRALLHALMRPGETGRAGQALAALGKPRTRRGTHRRGTSAGATRPRVPRRRRSNRSWTAQFPSTGGPGRPRLACWRRSRSAARPPLGTLWSAYWTWPNPMTFSQQLHVQGLGIVARCSVDGPDARFGVCGLKAGWIERLTPLGEDLTEFREIDAGPFFG
jgi:hypothetical protein